MFKTVKFIAIAFLSFHAILWIWASTFSPNIFATISIAILFIIISLGLYFQTIWGYWLTKISLFTYFPLTHISLLIASRKTHVNGPIVHFILSQNVYIQWCAYMFIIVLFLGIAYLINTYKGKFSNGTT